MLSASQTAKIYLSGQSIIFSVLEFCIVKMTSYVKNENLKTGTYLFMKSCKCTRWHAELLWEDV